MKYLSKLIENRNAKINFNMSKSFNENLQFANESDFEIDFPINPEISSWREIEHNGSIFLEKTYNFKTTDHLIYFTSELFRKSKAISYFPEIFIKENNVRLFLKSNFTNQVSDEDIQFSKFLDEIYEDIFYINR